ncbi:hypothetical protein PYW08_000141 [Mythimna loreyi]|uniref:Uncharacterized protein n=1 Tax=Mythimna loreyi TaxID=667449 RepID=A0ACC2RAM0_9NEOP|nr:hypothetical protein PYW08_000141 [Mythimna loreyi]
MKVTWVFMLALGVVSADVGLGYHYKVPQTSYGVPSYQFGANSGQYSSAYAGNRVQNTGYQTSASGSGYYQTSNSNSGQNVVQPSLTGYQTQYEASSQYQAALNKYQNYYQVQQQPAQVFKHFYVHAAPEEPEVIKPRAPIVLPPPQKHYKIIFVKAPTESSPPNLIAPIQPQSEEKTIVYVLVKKPDEQPDVVLPKIEQKPPSKPEVYFIKYKNKEDSQAVINNIVQDYNKGGQSISLSSGSSDGSSSFSSGLGSVQYQTPVQSTSGSYSQSFGLSSASNSGSSLESSPVTVSSTASSVTYEGGALSTSQGVPHETYGPPKFRVN